jgi:hypothetical protein
VGWRCRVRSWRRPARGSWAAWPSTGEARVEGGVQQQGHGIAGGVGERAFEREVG